MDDIPTFDEVIVGIRKLSRGTASGRSGIAPEMILYGDSALHHRIHKLLREVWISGVVPPEWRDAEIIPIPKKGDLQSCDDWRGISLLDVVGKLFARIVNDRLQMH